LVDKEERMKAEAIKSAYRRYATVYDLLFGRMFDHGRRLTVELVNSKPNQRILEVGVGTGLALSAYRSDARVHGIDLSFEMLCRARERVERESISQVESLLEMDAQHMAYADNSFDAVVAMYVASVVSDPAKMLAEMRRVCVPGGDIVVVNHFISDNPILRQLEKAVAPLSSLLGFRPDFCQKALLDIARLEVIEARDVNLFGYWKLIRFRNDPPTAEVVPLTKGEKAPLGFDAPKRLTGT
jgi:phosphatidylethanolamine/phosphatidyl-N-methylethanolamine N-methyltransferase